MVLRKFVLYAFILVILGCNYEPEEIYFKEVAQPSPEGMMIDLNSSSDTIYLFQQTVLTYQAEVGSREIHIIRFFLDNDEITIFSTPSATFYLSSINLQDGPHSLRVEMYTSTGSGSLGDVFGSEQFKITREWIAYVDKSVPQPVNFTKIEAANGTVELTWERYKQYNFQRYYLRKYSGSQLIWFQEITNQNTTTINDLSYMGGQVRYEIYVKGADQESAKRDAYFNYPYNPDLKLEWLDLQNLKLTWRKAPFYQNLVKYQITLFGNPMEYFSKTSLNDTTLIIQPNIKFGSQRDADVSVYPQIPSNTNLVLLASSDVTISIGDPITPFYGKGIIYNKQLNKYYVTKYVPNDNFTLIRLNGSSLAVEQQKQMNGEAALSSDGQLMYISSGNTIKQIDPLTFAELASYSTTGPGYKMSVTNNNLLIVTKISGSTLYKMPDFTILKSTTSQRMNFSSSGKYLISDGQLFEWNGSTYVAINNFSETGYYYGIFKGDDKLILVYMTQIKVMDLPTWTLQNTINKGDYYSETVVYDPESDLIGRFAPIGYGDTGTYYLYSLTNPTPVKTFEIGYTSISYGVYDVLVNNKLACSSGYLAPLSFFYP